MDDQRPELYTEVKLFNNAREREKFDNHSEVYSIVKTIQTLEKAYSKDFIKPDKLVFFCSCFYFKQLQNLTIFPVF